MHLRSKQPRTYLHSYAPKDALLLCLQLELISSAGHEFAAGAFFGPPAQPFLLKIQTSTRAAFLQVFAGG